MDMITGSNNQSFDIDTLQQTLTYTAAKLVETSTVVYVGTSYTQTLTYDGENLITNISIWEVDDLALKRNTGRTRKMLWERLKKGLSITPIQWGFIEDKSLDVRVINKEVFLTDDQIALLKSKTE